MIDCVCVCQLPFWKIPRMRVECLLVFEPHLGQNPASLSTFNSPLNNPQRTARQGGSSHRRGALGLAAAGVDMENPGVNKRSIAHRLHPRDCHRDSPPWGSGLEQCKQCESIIIKVFKISASVILLKKHIISCRLK